VSPDDQVTINAVASYYAQVRDWYKESGAANTYIPRPNFRCERESRGAWDERSQIFNEGPQHLHFHIQVRLPTDADDIAFRLKFAVDGFETKQPQYASTF
jgi:hypothetical protein